MPAKDATGKADTADKALQAASPSSADPAADAVAVDSYQRAAAAAPAPIGQPGADNRDGGSVGDRDRDAALRALLLEQTSELLRAHVERLTALLADERAVSVSGNVCGLPLR